LSSQFPGAIAVTHLSPQFSGALRTFAFWIANRSVGNPILDGIDYKCIFEEPSALEQAFAIFANVIELDDSGAVLNAKWAERRAAQYILQYVTGEAPDPPFADWETELHEPAPREDKLPWPISKR